MATKREILDRKVMKLAKAKKLKGKHAERAVKRTEQLGPTSTTTTTTSPSTTTTTRPKTLGTIRSDVGKGPKSALKAIGFPEKETPSKRSRGFTEKDRF